MTCSKYKNITLLFGLFNSRQQHWQTRISGVWSIFNSLLPTTLQKCKHHTQHTSRIVTYQWTGCRPWAIFCGPLPEGGKGQGPKTIKKIISSWLWIIYNGVGCLWREWPTNIPSFVQVPSYLKNKKAFRECSDKDELVFVFLFRATLNGDNKNDEIKLAIFPTHQNLREWNVACFTQF